MADPAYGRAHQARRAILLPLAYGTACPLCGFVMLEEEDLDLDHSTPVAEGGTRGDRITHAGCNRRAGQALGRARRWGPPPPLRTSGTY